MKTYRVQVEHTTTDILEYIRNRHNAEFQKWNSKDFYCLKSAELYAFNVSLHTGNPTKIKLIDLHDDRIRVQDRLRKLFKDEL